MTKKQERCVECGHKQYQCRSVLRGLVYCFVCGRRYK